MKSGVNSSSPDGRWSTAVTSEGIGLLAQRVEDMIAEAEARLPRHLTPQEQTQYLRDQQQPNSPPELP